MTMLHAIHPGEVLREEFLLPLNISAGFVARNIDVPRTRIERLVKEDVDMSPDTALRLARFFGTSAEFWTNIQSRYALEKATDLIEKELEHIQPLKMAS